MENIIQKTLPNGLTVCLIKKSGYAEKEAMLAVKCGSVNTRFLLDGIACEVPMGTAHFLEHKMFEKKHGNIFDDFSALGANVNAFTSSDVTAYYFTCTDKSVLDKCLGLLADMVTKPHFTAKGVEREMSIIGSEITMYKDDPYWQAHFGMLKGLYGDNAVSSEVAGSTETISHISADTLTLLYDSFYTADNAILIVAGDIDEESVFKLAESAFTLKPTSGVKPIIPKTDGISRVSVKKSLPIATPIFSLGFKENDNSLSHLMRMLSSKLLLNMLAGEGSVLYERLYTSGLCSSPLSADYICGNGYGVSVVSGSSQSPEKLLARLNEEIENFIGYGIAESSLKRVVEKCKGKLVKNMDSLDFCCTLAADCFAKSIKTLDIFDKYDTINSDELMRRLEAHFKTDNLCLSEVVGNI
jgi:predicted Zn-dependent peptidase